VINYFKLPGFWESMNRTTTITTLVSERKNGGPSCIPISQLLPLIHLHKAKSINLKKSLDCVIVLWKKSWHCVIVLWRGSERECVYVAVSMICIHTHLYVYKCTYKRNMYIMHAYFAYARGSLYTLAHKKEFVYTCI